VASPTNIGEARLTVRAL
jgi:hypothetical protein